MLNNNRLSNSIKERLLDYFYDGLSPTAAWNKLKSESVNYLQDSQHRSRIPYLRTVYYLFEKERNINFGPADICENSFKKLENEFNGIAQLKYVQSDDQWVMAFCSKLMMGAARLKEVSEKVICIDSTGGMDRTSGHLFNLVIPGPTGGLSIGMFVVFSENSKDISTGLRPNYSIQDQDQDHIK